MGEQVPETDAEREARQDAELKALQAEHAQQGTSATAPSDAPSTAPESPDVTGNQTEPGRDDLDSGPNDGPKLDADGDPVVPFTVEGTFDAEDIHDAYKLLQAHFMELSRTGNGTLHGVSVSKA